MVLHCIFLISLLLFLYTLYGEGLGLFFCWKTFKKKRNSPSAFTHSLAFSTNKKGKSGQEVALFWNGKPQKKTMQCAFKVRMKKWTKILLHHNNLFNSLENVFRSIFRIHSNGRAFLQKWFMAESFCAKLYSLKSSIIDVW